VLCAAVLMVTVASPASAAGAPSSERAAPAGVGAVVSGAFVDVVAGAAFYDDITWLAAQGISTGTAMGDGTFQFRPTEAVTREAMAAFLYRFAGSPGFTAPLASPFVDVAPTDPFYREIAWLAAKGISTGTALGDGTFAFGPTQAVSREAMAAFLYRAEGRRASTPPVTSPFVDVPTTGPFYKEIAWLAASGISTGTPMGDGTFEFRPAESVSREAMAAFLYRYKGKPAFTPPATSPFVDVPTTRPFYKEIAWLAASGISKGTDVGNGTFEFRPAESVSREAMAAFLHRTSALP